METTSIRHRNHKLFTSVCRGSNKGTINDTTTIQTVQIPILKGEGLFKWRVIMEGAGLQAYFTLSAGGSFLGVGRLQTHGENLSS